MPKILVKPLSVNKVWQGRRFKTKVYKEYEKDLLSLLPKRVKIPEKIHIKLTFGMSVTSDIDNPIKPFMDILTKKYDFNDNRVYRLSVEKKVVRKGEEYINFILTKFNEKTTI